MTEGADMNATVQPTTPSREDAVKAIRAALAARSGRAWSVRAGTGSVFDWIYICAPASRLVEEEMTEKDRVELGRLLGLDGRAPEQGVMVPRDRRREYVERAQHVDLDPHLVTVIEPGCDPQVRGLSSRDEAVEWVRALADDRGEPMRARSDYIEIGTARVVIAPGVEASR